MTEPSINLRNIVLSMLLEVDKGEKSHIVSKKYLDDYASLIKQQRAFITMLFNGTIERQIELDYIINKFSKIPVEKQKNVIKIILRMSVYQLKYMDSVPVSAICNEAVKLTVKRKRSGLKGFVNGVLRNISQNIENIEYPVNILENMSVKYSMPKWIIEMWNEQYGVKKTQDILTHIYDKRELTVRCNTSKASVNDIIKNLAYNNVNAEQSQVYENALRITGYDNLSKLDVFNAGMVTVQDESSMLAGLAADVRDNYYIIDVCAAPGGKSMHMSDMMRNTGVIEARDLTDYKIKLIESNIKTSGFSNIKPKMFDATVLDESSIEKADVVMADLPCSGLGVIGNKSDIKYNVTLEQIHSLVKLQRDILKVVSRYVKPGGRLVFSTCTVSKYENDENVQWILDNLPFKLVSLKGVLPKQINADKGYVQIFPGEYKMDGFFVSAFEKEK